MKKITLYSNPHSRGRIARWMLEEVGAVYDLEVMAFDSSIKSPAYLAINPMGKVPALKHGDTVITEVVAICTYLADQFPEKNLAPALSDAKRGSYYRWLFFVAGPLEMATTAIAYKWAIDETNAQSVGCGYVSDTINTLEMALKNSPYICGENFTAADVVLASYLGWGIMQKQIEARPVFTDYVARCEARPAAVRANQLDDALVK